jgi:thiosulfate/3-mercaptopyruvate sulfurtransferase
LLKSPEQLREMYSQAGFTGESQVITYCRTGHSASMTYFVLKYLGYDVRLYDGSFSEWQASAANPVESSTE